MYFLPPSKFLNAGHGDRYHFGCWNQHSSTSCYPVSKCQWSEGDGGQCSYIIGREQGNCDVETSNIKLKPTITILAYCITVSAKSLDRSLIKTPTISKLVNSQQRSYLSTPPDPSGPPFHTFTVQSFISHLSHLKLLTHLTNLIHLYHLDSLNLLTIWPIRFISHLTNLIYLTPLTHPCGSLVTQRTFLTLLTHFPCFPSDQPHAVKWTDSPGPLDPPDPPDPCDLPETLLAHLTHDPIEPLTIQLSHLTHPANQKS